MMAIAVKLDQVIFVLFSPCINCNFVITIFLQKVMNSSAKKGPVKRLFSETASTSSADSYAFSRSQYEDDEIGITLYQNYPYIHTYNVTLTLSSSFSCRLALTNTKKTNIGLSYTNKKTVSTTK